MFLHEIINKLFVAFVIIK